MKKILIILFIILNIFNYSFASDFSSLIRKRPNTDPLKSDYSLGYFIVDGVAHPRYFIYRRGADYEANTLFYANMQQGILYYSLWGTSQEKKLAGGDKGIRSAIHDYAGDL
ncbi:hypothetical protein, partial [Alkalithermobacter paradoxus]|uniref:hypothetical protein n=1 Tax=Alkalithermobacter paradoxus TaxID=29349 RepID=UPI00117CA686